VKETPESGVCWPGSQPGGFRAALDPVRRGLNYRAGEWFRLAAAAVDSLIRHGRGASLAPRSILSTAPLHHAGTLAKLDHLIRVHLHGRLEGAAGDRQGSGKGQQFVLATQVLDHLEA
jgi:hypothetical protein